MTTAPLTLPVKRRRLNPGDRINEILDAAALLVLEEGIANITMERIARHAGVSKGLLYAYFPNVKTLLQAVLVREHRDHQEAQLKRIGTSGTFEEMARATARINHERFIEKGLLVERLRSDPEVGDAMVNRDQRTRAAVLDYLTDEIMKHYAMPLEIARMATRLVIGAEHEISPLGKQQLDLMDDVWGAMMVGAMGELERRFGFTGGK